MPTRAKAAARKMKTTLKSNIKAKQAVSRSHAVKYFRFFRYLKTFSGCKKSESRKYIKRLKIVKSIIMDVRAASGVEEWARRGKGFPNCLLCAWTWQLMVFFSGSINKFAESETVARNFFLPLVDVYAFCSAIKKATRKLYDTSRHSPWKIFSAGELLTVEREIFRRKTTSSWLSPDKSELWALKLEDRGARLFHDGQRGWNAECRLFQPFHLRFGEKFPI